MQCISSVVAVAFKDAFGAQRICNESARFSHLPRYGQLAVKEHTHRLADCVCFIEAGYINDGQLEAMSLPAMNRQRCLVALQEGVTCRILVQQRVDCQGFACEVLSCRRQLVDQRQVCV